MNHDDTETLSDAPEEPTAPAADAPRAPADEAPEAAEAETPAPAAEATTVAEDSADDVTSPEVTSESAPEPQEAGVGAEAPETEDESSSHDEARSVEPEPSRVREPDPHAEIAQAEDPEAAARAALGLDDKVEEVPLKPEEAASILAAVAPTPEPEEEDEGVGAIQDIVLEPDLGGADLVEVFDDELVSREPSPYDRAGHWYVVHTYSGYEKKVKSNLESRVKSLHMEGRIHEVVIPMDDVIEFKGGKKVVVQKKVFPGYLLVRMDLEDETWQAVRNTPGVTAFVGGGAKPTPLSRKEVESILRVRPEEETRKARPRLDYEVGDQVRVTAGPFADFNGLIDEINVDQSTLKVLVNIFGRETPVTLDFADVAKL